MTIAGYVPAIGEKDLDKIIRGVRNLYEGGAASSDLTPYLTTTSAAATYLTTSSAAATYLSLVTAASTYATTASLSPVATSGSYNDLTTLAGVKVGSFTRDLSLASGTQAVTGVGFHPRLLIFGASLTSSADYSLGISDGSSDRMLYIQAAVGNIHPSNSILAGTDASNFQLGQITTLGSDGFTVTWAKTNSPTGTASIMYLAHR